MKQTTRIRIWMDYKEDGRLEETPTSLAFNTVHEAEKCIDYLNSKKTDNRHGYFYRKETESQGMKQYMRLQVLRYS